MKDCLASNLVRLVSMKMVAQGQEPEPDGVEYQELAALLEDGAALLEVTQAEAGEDHRQADLLEVYLPVAGKVQ